MRDVVMSQPYLIVIDADAPGNGASSA